MFVDEKSYAGRMCSKIVSKAAGIAGGVTTAVASFGTAHADILTDTQTAISGAAADGLTVGGYVVAGVCSLLVIGLIIGLVHKLR